MREAGYPASRRGRCDAEPHRKLTSSEALLDASPALLRQPHRVELIVEVVARRYRPATHAGSVRHDTVPLERVDVVRLLVEEAPFEGADVSSALRGINRATLADIEVV